MPKHTNCLVCGAPPSLSNMEWDHFPIPSRLGGTGVVSLCESCHHMVDRKGLGHLLYDIDIRSAWQQLNPDGRMLLLKVFKICIDPMLIFGGASVLKTLTGDREHKPSRRKGGPRTRRELLAEFIARCEELDGLDEPFSEVKA